MEFAAGKRLMARIWRTLSGTINEFLNDDCMSMAAALAYYTVFSLPPLLLIVITIAGSVFGSAAVQGRIDDQIRGLIGPSAAQQVQTMIAQVKLSGSTGPAAVFGAIALAFAATTAFAQLQSSLNRAWEVEPAPTGYGVRNFLLKRVLSFGMILAIGFLLLVSLALSAAITGFSAALNSYLPAFLSARLLHIVSAVFSFAVIGGLFAAMYKVLPDAEVEWRDVSVGAVVTAALFNLGKYLVGLYLGNSSVLTPYGAAGSLALILLWTYYSAMIFLLGAEFTQVWAQRHGRPITPQPGAVRVVREKRRVDSPQPAGRSG